VQTGHHQYGWSSVPMTSSRVKHCRQFGVSKGSMAHQRTPPSQIRRNDRNGYRSLKEAEKKARRSTAPGCGYLRAPRTADRWNGARRRMAVAATRMTCFDCRRGCGGIVVKSVVTARSGNRFASYSELTAGVWPALLVGPGCRRGVADWWAGCPTDIAMDRSLSVSSSQ